MQFALIDISFLFAVADMAAMQFNTLCESTDIWMINNVYVEFERRVCLEKTFDHRG